MNWSFQLYSARNFQPWAHVLETLARLGYAHVEGFGEAYSDPAGLRAELDRNGLTMPSGHFSMAMLEQDFHAVEHISEVLGIELVVCPWLDERERPRDAAGWRALGGRLAAIGDRAENVGLDFAWHNHDFEFMPLADGSVPLELILEAAPNIGWEIDVAWVTRAGASAIDWIEQQGNRIVAVHVKDIALDGEAREEDGWSDVGHGTIDWPWLLKALRNRTRARYFVMEHDNPADFERFARRSIEAAKNF